jgi:phosphopantothenoylcysteine decarboxylase/phosphopantothenate--cysteine ligase
VMTPAAREFVGAVTFEALTGRPVHSEIFGAGNALDHVKLARAANAIVVAPATADFCARAASGQANDLLTAVLLAASAPVMFVPAMNDHMWAHPQTKQNIAHLQRIGYHVVPPDDGLLAVGEGSGPGRMPEPESIFAHVGWLLEDRRALGGKRIVVTSGPTREPIDPVRYISNHSSGKMGNAIAAAAWRRGAEVVLVTGPSSIPVPNGVCVVRVETTEQMRDAVARELPSADALVMAAAPADFRAATVAGDKIKKASAPSAIALAPTPDILGSTINARPEGCVVVGFALETNDVVRQAREKLDRKQLDLIVVNDATEAGAGFGVDTNRVTLLARDGADEELPLMPKRELADVIVDRVVRLMHGR